MEAATDSTLCAFCFADFNLSVSFHCKKQPNKKQPCFSEFVPVSQIIESAGDAPLSKVCISALRGQERRGESRDSSLGTLSQP